MAPSLCSACQTIDFESLRCPSLEDADKPLDSTATPYITATGHRQAQFGLGLLTDLRARSTDCRLCALFLKTISTRPNYNSAREAEIACFASNEYFGVYFTSKGERRIICRLSVFTTEVGKHQDWSGCHARYCFQACAPGTARAGLVVKGQDDEDIGPPQSETIFSGRLRPLDVNVSWLRYWLSNCSKGHGPTCSPLETEKREKIVRFVDVKTMAVVTCQDVVLSHVPYMALSYVWGKDQRLKLTASNIETLSMPGALNADAASLTISDALELARRMEVKYVWIDALCIIQDSDDDKKAQIRAMGRIYNSADVTLIAASGDNADAGLPGLRAGTRHKVQEEVEVIRSTNGNPGLSLLTTLNPKGGANSHHSAETKWESRGWTFQERHLARRVLTFTKEQVFFSCNKDEFCEESYFEHRVRLQPNNQASIDLSLGLDRQHLEPEDPKERLWTRYRLAVVRFTRRNFGCEGDVHDAFAGLAQNVLRLYDERFRWGLPESRFNEALTWSTFVGQHRRDGVTTLPMTELNRKVKFPSWSWMGWVGEAYVSVTSEREELGEGAIVDAHIHQKTDTGIYLTCVDGGPGDPTLDERLFGSIDISQEALNNIPSGHILFFWANRAYLSCSGQGDQEPEYARTTDPDRSAKQGTILDTSGNKIGSLGRMHISHWERGAYDSGLWEFVAISRRQILDFEAYVTVLQVERIEGIAYRVNIGEVREGAWLAANPDRVFMILG